MTLTELSLEYAHTANTIHQRIVALRQEAAESTTTRQKRSEIRQRIAALKPLLQDTRAMSVQTAQYYNRRTRRHVR